MDYALDEPQEMLKKMARDFLEKECPESFVREMEEDDTGFSPELWRKMAGLGWLGITFPEQYSGTAGRFLDMTVLYEEMGRAMLPSPHLSTVVLCGQTILAAGSEEQRSELLPKIVNGELVMSLALTEPASACDDDAWDAGGIKMPAKADVNDYIIDGTKLFVHDAAVADYFIVATRTGDGTATQDGVTLFLVDAGSPGISRTTLRTTAGDKQCEVIFKKVKVDKKNIIGKLNEGWPALSKALQQGAVLLCAAMVGAGQRALEMSVDYAKTRIQFDMPIGINQFVQDHCVNLLAEIEASKWVTYQAAWKLSENLPADMEVAIAKAWTSDSHERACWYAHQVMAGIGYVVDDGALPLISRRGKAQQLYLGDTSYHLKKVAAQMYRWPAPEKYRGKPLGLWNRPQEEQIPAWQPWRERYETIEKRKVAQRKS